MVRHIDGGSQGRGEHRSPPHPSSLLISRGKSRPKSMSRGGGPPRDPLSLSCLLPPPSSLLLPHLFPNFRQTTRLVAGRPLILRCAGAASSNAGATRAPRSGPQDFGNTLGEEEEQDNNGVRHCTTTTTMMMMMMMMMMMILANLNSKMTANALWIRANPRPPIVTEGETDPEQEPYTLNPKP